MLKVSKLHSWPLMRSKCKWSTLPKQICSSVESLLELNPIPLRSVSATDLREFSSKRVRWSDNVEPGARLHEVIYFCRSEKILKHGQCIENCEENGGHQTDSSDSSSVCDQSDESSFGSYRFLLACCRCIGKRRSSI